MKTKKKMSIDRTEQINIRVTEQERDIIYASARKQGFRGASDFIRWAALKDIENERSKKR